MKKIISCFLIVCVIAAVQLFGHELVSAKSVPEWNDFSANSMERNEQFPIPELVKLQQISPNQVQISYDRNVDVNLAVKAANYWVQDIMNAQPTGIATLGRNDKANASNSLNDKLVKITPKNGSENTYILTFSKNIPKGEGYKLIVCYVTVKGAPPYSGDNGMENFIGR